MNDFETTKQVSPLTNSELERDIVNELMAFEAVHANEDADMAIRAAKEISRLRAALCSSSQVPDGRNEVSTEAQPEVTGAVAQLEPIGYIDREQLKRWDILRGTEFEVAERAYIPFSKSPFKSEFTDCTLPVYSEPSPSAIEGYAQELAKDIASKLVDNAVKEKLEAAIAVALAEKVDAEATGAESDIAYNAAIDHAVEAIRALMESPHTSVEEPAN